MVVNVVDDLSPVVDFDVGGGTPDSTDIPPVGVGADRGARGAAAVLMAAGVAEFMGALDTVRAA